MLGLGILELGFAYLILSLIPFRIVQIKELEDCLGRLLVTQHRLQSIRANYTLDDYRRNRLDSAITRTHIIISKIRYRLTDLYHENNILDRYALVMLVNMNIDIKEGK